jgi:hypothetical protein
MAAQLAEVLDVITLQVESLRQLLSEPIREEGPEDDARAAATALRAALELGSAVRSLDPAGDHHEVWTNDGDYIPYFNHGGRT